MADPNEWCTIESDPGVFTSLIKGIGVKNCQVEEIYTLEDEQLLKSLGEMYGLVFLFKYVKQEPRECLSFYDQDLFFCNQVIQNACATQALLAILLNNQKIQLGEELKEFKSFTKDFDPQTRGQALSNQPLVKNVHNSFQRAEPFGFIQSDNDDKKGGDAYHFISYVPFKGKVYELDGLQSGPILIGEIGEGQEWLDIAKQEINKRIQKYSEEEIMFNLMGVIQDRCQEAERVIKQENTKKLAHYLQMQNKNIKLSEFQDGDFKQLNETVNKEELNSVMVAENLTEQQYSNIIQESNTTIQIQNNTIQQEKEKQEKQRLENVRRKHNYIPFILQLLKMTAKKGKLQGLVEQAKIKQEEREAQKKKQAEKQKK